nr:ModD protein [uncultured Cohaesibacter sp.]
MIVLDDAILMSYLKEDAPYGDMTSRPLNLGSCASKMGFFARYDMTVCAVEEAARLLQLIGCEVECCCRTGERLSAGAPILEAVGDGETILLGWKVSQVLVEWASGVATATSTLVDTAKKSFPDAVIACTRKSVPGTRALSAKAIIAGGAALHRTGLSDTILLFPEHRALAEPSLSLADQILKLKRANPERNVVVEVKDIEDAVIVASAGADVLQLEKFEPAKILHLKDELAGKGLAPKIAAAGGINPNNVADYAATDVDILVTSYPYYAKPADVQVIINKV